jgi:hypothetical protein
MKDSLVQQCLDILKRDDVKNEFKTMLKPLIDFILYEINPYIYITWHVESTVVVDIEVELELLILHPIVQQQVME